ncbi:MAG: FtsW/RodA/SpoVE family cell cycle protein [Prevotella sp.]|nr:FtsW/RodA/SpoVE family cell cycle protein [Prevotella sp.]
MEKKFTNLFKGDKVIWMVFFFLCVVSVIEVYSASSMLTYKSGNYLYPVIYHTAILLVGVFCAIVTLNIPCRFFKIATPLALILSLVTLIAVFFIGHKENDAARWIGIFGIKFQPSEIAKGALILATAQILSALQREKGADKNAMPYILWICAFIIPLIFIENFSTAALLSFVIFLMMVIGRVPWQQLGKLVSAVIIAGVLAVMLIMNFGDTSQKNDEEGTQTEMAANTGKTDKDSKEEKSLAQKVFHRLGAWKMRIEDFTNKDPQKKYDLKNKPQRVHGNIAIGTSSLLGKGPGNSVERDFLPAAHCDFIYAIIIEEMGLIGGIAVAALYIILLFRTARIARRCENNFPAFLAIGIALLLVVQACFNMYVAVDLAPITGQPLPLISKGGTSSIINCIYIGVLLSISRTAKVAKDKGGEEELKPEMQVVNNG